MVRPIKRRIPVCSLTDLDGAFEEGFVPGELEAAEVELAKEPDIAVIVVPCVADKDAGVDPTSCVLAFVNEDKDATIDPAACVLTLLNEDKDLDSEIIVVLGAADPG